mmetsp:Transcript_22477/g.42854  ORF Transcript_22477/g.42854 Transcript_22477/m.42854 type:complete len:218 (-) Transcript_22477:288-941(-)
MAHLSNPRLTNTQKSYATVDTGSLQLSANLAHETPCAGSFPGGVPPGHEWQRRRQFPGSSNAAPRAALTSLAPGATLHVTAPTHEETQTTGGKMRLTKDPAEFFQQTQGMPATMLARDRQTAGFLGAQTMATRVYENGQGYHRQGIHSAADYTTSNKMPVYSKEQSNWATTNQLTHNTERPSYDIDVAPGLLEYTHAANVRKTTGGHGMRPGYTSRS